MEIHRSTGQRLVLTSERSLHGHLFHKDEEDLPRSAGHAVIRLLLGSQTWGTSIRSIRSGMETCGQSPVVLCSLQPTCMNSRTPRSLGYLVPYSELTKGRFCFPTGSVSLAPGPSSTEWTLRKRLSSTTVYLTASAGFQEPFFVHCHQQGLTYQFHISNLLC